jgi:hypothetical protein
MLEKMGNQMLIKFEIEINLVALREPVAIKIIGLLK